MADYEVGYGKPPKRTQIGQPDGPPAGKTSEQKIRELANANKASIVREKFIDALLKDIGDGKNGGSASKHLNAATLKLIKDTEDRAYGAPKQTVETDVTVSAPKGLDTFYGDASE